MNQTPTRDVFVKDLRDALNHIQDPAFLRRSPLAATFGVGNKFDTFSSLQQILVDAIRALDPGDDEPMHSRAWRTYDCLFYRYVQQFTQQEVADQIGISTRQLQREQQAALERLADQLWERIDLDADNDQMVTADGMLSDATVAVVSDELEWLRDISAKGHAEPAQLLSAAVNLVEPLAENHGVRIYLEMDTALPALAANAVALNQTLLNLLTIAIHRAECCERCVHISAHATRWGTRIEISCDGGRRTPAADDKSSLGMAFQLAELGGAKLSVDETGDRFHSTLTLQAIEQMPVVVIDDNEDALQSHAALCLRHTFSSGWRQYTRPNLHRWLRNMTRKLSYST